MGITRLIIIGLLIWLAWMMYRRFIQYQNTKQQSTKTSQESVSNIKKCAVCGVHVPQIEAIKKGDRYYCSKAHCDQDNA